jgi:hypothetical protein
MISPFTVREKQCDAYGQASCKGLCILNNEIEDSVTVGVISRYVISRRQLTTVFFDR